MIYYVGGSAAGVVPGLVWNRAHWGGCVALVVFVQLVTVALAIRFWGAPAPDSAQAQTV
jgi:sugar phosphate permease